MKSHDEFARERMKCDDVKGLRKYAELFKGSLLFFKIIIKLNNIKHW